MKCIGEDPTRRIASDRGAGAGGFRRQPHEAREFGDGTTKLIDEEVQRILREAEERAYQLLKDHLDPLELLTAALMEWEELDRDDVSKLLGPRPAGADAAFRSAPCHWPAGRPTRPSGFSHSPTRPSFLAASLTNVRNVVR